MSWTLLLEQMLNGFQLGFLLFLIAAGLTLVFGIMLGVVTNQLADILGAFKRVNPRRVLAHRGQ